MKLINSKPAKYAETVGRNKFIKLSSSRQHEYLAYLAHETLKNNDFEGFIKRYKEMLSWVELDRYTPPDYLNEKEALYEYFLFHNGLTNSPQKLPENDLYNSQGLPLTWQSRFDVTIVLDQVRSPYNVGSVLRLIDNFGFRRLVHNSEWLRLDHPQLCRSARGCERWIPVELKKDIPGWLLSEKNPVIGLETTEEAQDIEKWQPQNACILVLGNEAYGIASELRRCCDRFIKIPMYGFKKSMNIHHALAIAGQKITSAGV